MAETTKKAPKQVGLGVAILCVVILCVIFCGGFTFWKVNTQVIFLMAAIAMAVVGLFHGHKLSDVQEYFLEGCRGAVMPALILMTVGAVIGSWMVSGIVPTIIYYGLGILTPKIFLLAGFIMCCLISFFTGLRTLSRFALFLSSLVLMATPLSVTVLISSCMAFICSEYLSLFRLTSSPTLS